MTKTKTAVSTLTSFPRRMLDTCTPKLDLSPQVRLMIRLASACLVVYWLAIFLATHMPSAALPKLTYSDKVYHAGAFAGLSFLLCWALPTREGFSARWRQISIAGVISVSYGCIDELTQQFIPGRCCDIWDMAADSVGVLIGISCYLACRQLLIQFEFGRNIIAKFSR